MPPSIFFMKTPDKVVDRLIDLPQYFSIDQVFLFNTIKLAIKTKFYGINLIFIKVLPVNGVFAFMYDLCRLAIHCNKCSSLI